MSATTWVGIALLGGSGAVLRLLVSSGLALRLIRAGRPAWAAVPVATLTVNLAGSLALGLIAGAALREGQVPAVLGLGLLGSFTTFSTWMVESAGLTESRHRLAGLGLIGVSLLAGLLAVWLGYEAGGLIG